MGTLLLCFQQLRNGLPSLNMAIPALTPKEIYSKFIKVYGDSSPLFSTIKKWAAKFKHGHTSLEDDPRE